MWSTQLLKAGLQSAIEYEGVLWEKELTEGLAALRDEQLYIRFLDESIRELEQTQEKLTAERHTEAAHSTEATAGISLEEDRHLGEDYFHGARGSAHRSPTHLGPGAAHTALSSEELQDVSIGNPPSAQTDESASTLIVRISTTQLWWEYTSCSQDSADGLAGGECSGPLIVSAPRAATHGGEVWRARAQAKRSQIV